MNHPIYEAQEQLQCSCFNETEAGNYTSGLKRAPYSHSMLKANQNRKAQSNQDKFLKQVQDKSYNKSKVSLRREKSRVNIPHAYHHSTKSGFGSQAQLFTPHKISKTKQSKEKLVWGNIIEQPLVRNNSMKQTGIAIKQRTQQVYHAIKPGYQRVAHQNLSSVRPFNFEKFQNHTIPTSNPNKIISNYRNHQNTNQRTGFQATKNQVIRNVYVPPPNFYPQNQSKQIPIARGYPYKYRLSEFQSHQTQNHNAQKISLSNRNSQYENDQRSIKNASQFDNKIISVNIGESGCPHYELIQPENTGRNNESYRIYMKQIQSVVDDNQYNDQISQVVGKGWQINRQEQFYDLQNTQQLRKTTLQTLPSNSQNSGTTHSAFGMAESHFKRF